MSKFEYKNFEIIERDMMRYYNINGKLMPSITTILGKTVSEEKRKSLENWRTSLGKTEADRKTKLAAYRGVKLHLLAERYLKKEELIQNGDNITRQDLGIFNGFKLKLNSITEIWGQEIVVYSDILEVAGRCDLAGIYNKSQAIIDFKTTTKLKTKAEIEDYFLQATFYALAHNEMYYTEIDTLVILMVNEMGFPLEFIEKITENRIITLAERIDLYYSKML